MEKEGKLAPELQEWLEDADPEERIEVYVILYDVDHDKVMEQFHSVYPEEYAAYQKARNSNNFLTAEITYDPSLKFSEDWTEILKNEEPLYTEEIQEQAEIDEPEESSEVIEEDEISDDLVLTRQIAEVDCLLANGYDGDNVKIGQIEKYWPNYTDPAFSAGSVVPVGTGTIDCNQYHATNVAKILVGVNGFAPEATLYSATAIHDNEATLYESVELLLIRGVNVINISFAIKHGGTYEVTSKWLDYVAFFHQVHCIVAVGNDDTDEGIDPNVVKLPATAYNAITVGSFDSNSNMLAEESSYVEYASVEKPNLVARGVNIFQGSTIHGTSFATPQVAGVIADLFEINDSLKTRPEIIGAMIAAGSPRKVEGYYGHGLEGDFFISSVQVDGNNQISDKEGAGKLNAAWLRSILSSFHCWYAEVASSSFAYEKNVYINASLTSISRVGIFWLKQNSISGSRESETLTNPNLSDLDLYIFDPNGNRVGYSITSNANFEIVQFWPEITGNYTICITKWGGQKTASEYLGIALW